MTDGPTYGELCHLLRQQLDLVIDRYCTREGAFRDNSGRFFCLNPMRVDRNVGSFWIETRGRNQGKWVETLDWSDGDMMDMILAIERGGPRDAAKIAKGILGRIDIGPRDMARIREQAERRKEQQANLARQEAAARAKREQGAQAMWLGAKKLTPGDPVTCYLGGRGIHLDQIGVAPGALRYQPECYYRHDDADGVVHEARMPAMLAAISDIEGQCIGVHRTYLAIHPGGRVTKAAVPAAKKVYGSVIGGSIRLSRGVGPKGGRGAGLNQCPPGTHVLIAEGIEDALSAVMLNPEWRVIAAITGGNMVTVKLPQNVSAVTLIADNDDGDECKARHRAAEVEHQRAGRRVKVFRAPHPHKDLNDYLIAEMEAAHV